MRTRRMLGVTLPGLLVAATGVGAGDLATAAFAGTRLGVAVLWAVALGALLKFVLTEGIARWQLATGSTVLEGAADRLGRFTLAAFAIYLLPWTFFVGAALISACGVTAHAIVRSAAPALDGRISPDAAKLVLGGLHSAAGAAVVWLGGFRVFQRVMSVCIGVMFIAVLGSAFVVAADWPAIAQGLVAPRIPRFDDGGLTWTIGLMGGVGGTVTILCYGYWIRESGRTGAGAIRTCRVDLAVGYLATALFGIAMLVIASQVRIAEDARGVSLIVALAERLREALGPAGMWMFLVGAWAAVFSSLLGVWQSVPYLAADVWRVVSRRRVPGGGDAIAREPVDTRSRPYRLYLLALAIVPLVQVRIPFSEAQKLYAVMGAFFLPLLALVLLIMNGRSAWVGAAHRNRPWTAALLALTLAFFAAAGYLQLR